ncbi:uncharacterized protein LOC117182727 [Belonocnema kinseyi]|uniref:uncharacterized protein LOC117182727 n=1 Tax=Belonocnema kinseyi TaxID=2817044 RepID=UPI00143D3233|nr:uncharacterized protein LOC117182727 [Belonocnema kinseyi]
MYDEQGAEGIQSRIKIILKRVGVCKAQNTLIKKLLVTYLHRPQEINKAEDHLQKYLELFKDFQEQLEELETLDKEDQHDQIGIRCKVEGKYLEIFAEYEKLKAMARGETTSDVRSISEAVTESTIIHRRRLKLLESALPTFNGEYENWISFKAEYEAMIHNEIDISDVDKFTYLRRVTTGPAHDKMKVLAITADNYSRAWALLDKTYSDQRLIISRHINLLLDIPEEDHETASGLSKLVDETRQHKEMLRSMGVEINEELLVTLLERKLFRTTAYNWDETIEQGIFPKLDDLLEFLSRRAACLIN